MILEIDRVSKIYASGRRALDSVSLEVGRGEIFALLGPNGAGKTTLIGIVCGLVEATSGQIRVDGRDHVRDYRYTRSRIGLVPQELTTDAFATVWATVSFSRGLFGKPPAPQYLEQVLRALSLWERRDDKLLALSGGMKRRVLIAKALSHEPSLLFLDEPTAGVDVELRQSMWALVRRLRDDGVTVILTTHYIEEAEEMADRIGVLQAGRLLLVEQKDELMRTLGRKQLVLQLRRPLAEVPASLAAFELERAADGGTLTWQYDAVRSGHAGHSGPGVAELIAALAGAGIEWSDLRTEQSSLEDIFVRLVRGDEQRIGRPVAS